jgi:hypothetical protein
MIRMLIATAVLLLPLTGCVEPMPPNDEDNRILNQMWKTEGPEPWRPRMLFE